MSGLPPFRHEADGPDGGDGQDGPDGRGVADRGASGQVGAGRRRGPRSDRARTLRRFGVAALVVIVVGLGAGTLFGRVDPERAARLVVSEYTVTEDGPEGVAGPDPVFPVTGPDRGTPACGRSPEPLSPERQVATVASGVVIIQHRPAPGADEEQVLEQLAARERVVVAPNDELGEEGPAVVATSWRHRMVLGRVDLDLLDAFVTGHADRAPALAACP